MNPPNPIPLDNEARNGRYQLVLRPGGAFTLARWLDGAFRCSSGNAIDFEPTYYQPGKDHTGMLERKETTGSPAFLPDRNGAASGRAEGSVGTALQVSEVPRDAASASNRGGHDVDRSAERAPRNHSEEGRRDVSCRPHNEG
ncbi:hypothetical protein [Novosphingobium sp. KN65.2]|uniref:hypothetical protein n=1 Tax=Novosphingobium sp. KN65.2 TaxID=1478134 RepID=UPI0005E8DAB6|nr:hypothetical protein [Novosphingobium sp. KN65.2]CDO37636.1 hypothetical protein SPHV1_370023 [Novosphingobium sp. KN65.2]